MRFNGLNNTNLIELYKTFYNYFEFLCEILELEGGGRGKTQKKQIKAAIR